MDEVRLPTPPPVVHAPLLHLPRPEAIRKIATVEYPAPVRSLDAAVRSLGGLARVSRALESDPPAAHPVELDLDPRNRFAHAVPSHVEQTRNVVCRVVKRRRKVPKRDEHGNILEDGVYSIEPVGLEHRLVRFRGAHRSLSHAFPGTLTRSWQPWPTTSTPRSVANPRTRPSNSQTRSRA